MLSLGCFGVFEHELVEERHQPEVAQRIARVADRLGACHALCKLDNRRVVVVQKRRELPQPAPFSSREFGLALVPVVPHAQRVRRGRGAGGRRGGMRGAGIHDGARAIGSARRCREQLP